METNKKLKPEVNKSLLLGLIILTVLIVFFGIAQIRYNIFNPFEQDEMAVEPTREDIINVYKSLDTDQDGLSDYQELADYNTSIYLPDSDSDGFTDKEEIEAKSDPLNPESTPKNKVVSGQKTVLGKEIKGESEEIIAQEIRNLLINQAGLSPEIVNNILDKDLIKLYNETKEETGINLEELSKQAIKSGNLSEIEKIDAQTLRQLLISQGVDEEMLDQIDDQTLEILFQESLPQ